MNSPADPATAHPGQNDELIRDLERRIETLQNMDDSELGTFGKLDWIILILASIVIPVIAVVMAQ